jgi:hypothetical protein
VELRRRLLPDEPRVRTLAYSALDPAWLYEVDSAEGVLITAQGLLMYFSPDEARGLLARCAAAFPGESMVFDVVPHWLVERSRRGSVRMPSGYEPPPWSWGFDRTEGERLRALPNIADLHALRLPRGRGLLHGLVLPVAANAAVVRRLLLSVLAARFA